MPIMCCSLTESDKEQATGPGNSVNFDIVIQLDSTDEFITLLDHSLTHSSCLKPRTFVAQTHEHNVFKLVNISLNRKGERGVLTLAPVALPFWWEIASCGAADVWSHI